MLPLVIGQRSILVAGLLLQRLPFRQNSPLLLGKLIHNALRKAEIIFQEGTRVAAQPTGERNRLILPAVEQDQDFGGFVADLLDVVTVALLNETDMPRSEFLRPGAAVRTEDADPRPPLYVVMPLVGMRMPV